jgi:hypothetical protein
VLSVPLVLACNVAGALVAGPSRVRRALALMLSGLGFAALVAFPPPFVALRGWTWLAAWMLFMRMVDLTFGAPLGVPERLAMVLVVFDPRAMRPVRPSLAPGLVAKGLGFAVLGVAGFVIAALAARVSVWPLAIALRWLAGAVFFYAGMDAVDGFFRALFRAAGLAAPPLQIEPIRARSLAEFWGRRWNREVGRWLDRWCFRPLARRGHPVLGLLAAFAWSGLFHGVATWGAVGLAPALVMAAFFLVHGGLVLVERAVGVGAWPAWAGHGWVLAVFVVTGPMFVEPLLELMGLPFPRG